MRVLMADGDQTLLEVVERYLTHHGHEVRIAASGLECLALLRRDAPDVVVLHRGLPWGGSEGVRELMQEVAPWSEIPVILTWDDEFPEDSANATSSPWAAQLRKPYRLEKLLGHLQACLADGESPRFGVVTQGGMP